MTHCELLFMWMVEPYNTERVMRQFGLYQSVPPPPPRRVNEEIHTQDNKGQNYCDWSAHNMSWIQIWNNEASSNIVRENRHYDHHRTPMYNQWYYNSTRTLLAGPPPSRIAKLTQDDQLIDGYRQIARDSQHALGLPNVNSTTGKSLIRRILNTAMSGLKRFGCTRDDDTIPQAYDMSEAPSSRPNEVGTSQRHTIHTRRTTSGRTTAPTFPRRRILYHGLAHTEDDTPILKARVHETISPTWEETRAGLGHNMDRSECRSERFNTTHDTIESTRGEMAASYGYTMPQL